MAFTPPVYSSQYVIQKRVECGIVRLEEDVARNGKEMKDLFPSEVSVLSSSSHKRPSFESHPFEPILKKKRIKEIAMLESEMYTPSLSPLHFENGQVITKKLVQWSS